MDPNSQPTQPLSPAPDQGLGAPPTAPAPGPASSATPPVGDPGAVSPVPVDPSSPSAALPPTMADPNAAAAGVQTGGNKKVLGFVFVIAGVLALIALIVIGIQVLL